MTRMLLLLTLLIALATTSAEAAVRAYVSYPAMQIPPPQLVDSLDDTLRKEQPRSNWWQENQTPSTRFRPTQLIAPASFIAVGALGVGDKALLRRPNIAIRDGFRKLSNGKQLHFDDYIQYLPVGLYLALDYMGVEAKHTIGERVAVGTVTYLAVVAFSQGVKYTVREPRPDTGRRNSFPSGHTTTAFAGAELVRTEYGWGAGVCAYAVATTVGVMRMYNGRHWFNDVVAGVGFGILSARIGYWMLPLSRHIFKIPREGQALIATPIYDTSTRALGVSCAVQF